MKEYKDKKEFLREALRRLKLRYKGEMHSTLSFANSWELLVATMLSAQSQDKQVNVVTSKLFKAYKTPYAFAKLRPAELYRYTRSLGLYRNKSKNIIKTARIIAERFGGSVPSSIDGLTSLPGVGRKTANVVLYNGFGKNSGIAIDTHCITVANRLGLVNTKSAVKIEDELMQITKRDDWGDITHLFIALGRDVCRARDKRCAECVLNDICPSSTLKAME